MNAISVHKAASDISSVRHYLSHALAENTLRAYKADLDHYFSAGADIPSSPETVAAYLSTHAATLSIATLQRRLVSIGKAHTMQSHPDPTKSDLVRLTMRGIRRIHGRPQKQVSPILRDDLIAMLSYLPDKVKGCRDKALLLLGFCSALRRSELVAVRVEDIAFSSQGIILTVPRGKTDQMGEGRTIGIPRGRGRICPVMSVNDWIVHLGVERGPVFRSITKGGAISDAPLSGHAVALIVKRYAGLAGLDPEEFSGHSLRAGLATAAAQEGKSSWAIRRQTGHKSDCMLARYIREGSLFTDNAAALF